MSGYRLRCPDCRKVFTWNPSAKLPDYCPLCGSYVGIEAEERKIPKAPRIRNQAKVKAVDDVYYSMEDASKARAELMAQHTPGASASDFSHTLITDMNDRQKPGDIAWKPPRLSTPIQGNFAGNGNANRPEFAHIPQGGLGAMRDLQARHHSDIGSAVKAATVGKY